MTQYNLHDIHLSLTKACIKAAWLKICKKSVFVVLLYLLLLYGGAFQPQMWIDIKQQHVCP